MMTTIEEKSERFACPAGIATSRDFCFDLTDLQRGVQYTSEVVYETADGRWSDGGQPLFFILVEAGLFSTYSISYRTPHD